MRRRRLLIPAGWHLHIGDERSYRRGVMAERARIVARLEHIIDGLKENLGRADEIALAEWRTVLAILTVVEND